MHYEAERSLDAQREVVIKSRSAEFPYNFRDIVPAVRVSGWTVKIFVGAVNVKPVQYSQSH